MASLVARGDCVDYGYFRRGVRRSRSRGVRAPALAGEPAPLGGSLWARRPYAMPPIHSSTRACYLNTRTPVYNIPANSRTSLFSLSELPLVLVSGLCVRPAGAFSRAAIAYTLRF